MAKVVWIRLGDANDAYFHDILKSKNKYANMGELMKEDGASWTAQEDIEAEIFQFYGKLMETAEINLQGVDIVAIRRGNQVENTRRRMVIAPITIKEIEEALKSIGELKAPGIDEYGSKFFKDF